MMKTTIIKNIGCGLLLLGTTACADYLDKESFDIITPEQVWQDPKLINGVMVNLYDGLNLEDFNYWYRDAWRLQNASSMSDEAQGSFQKDPLFDNGNATYTYEILRSIQEYTKLQRLYLPITGSNGLIGF